MVNREKRFYVVTVYTFNEKFTFYVMDDTLLESIASELRSRNLSSREIKHLDVRSRFGL